MKHLLLVVGLGAVAGIATHVGWYEVHRPCRGEPLECQLAWIRTELRLSDDQYERIRSIHERSSPRLLALAAQVARMREEYVAFERERATAGQVDFVEFARFVDQRRTIDRECLSSTRALVMATCDAMEPEQRVRYLGLLHPALMERNPASPQ